jgi:8-oxo-dGTP diphosphatase
VERDGQLLMMRRRWEPWAGRWDIPGGFCEEDEHPILAAEREVLEETGLAVEVIGYLGAWLDIQNEETTLNLFYHGVVVGSTGLHDAEATAIGWLDPSTLTREVLAFPDLHERVLAAWWQWRREGRTLHRLLDRPTAG